MLSKLRSLEISLIVTCRREVKAACVLTSEVRLVETKRRWVIGLRVLKFKRVFSEFGKFWRRFYTSMVVELL